MKQAQIMTVILSGIFTIGIDLALSQDSREEIGAYSPGGEYVENSAPQPSWEERDQQNSENLLDGHIYRRIDGQIHNLLIEGKTITGDVEAVDNGIVILENPNSMATERFAIKNYCGKATENQRIQTRALANGTYNWGIFP